MGLQRGDVYWHGEGGYGNSHVYIGGEIEEFGREEEEIEERES